MKFLTSLGVIRTIFLLLVVFVIVMAPFAMGGARFDSVWALTKTVIVPSLLPFFFFLLPMDMTMCRAIQDGQSDEVRQHYRKIIYLELMLWAVMIAAWVPFIVSITN